MSAYPSIGKIHRIDPAFDALIAPDARLEKLADGFTWTEGPVWVRNGGYLLFSDMPDDVRRRWDRQGVREVMRPSKTLNETLAILG